MWAGRALSVLMVSALVGCALLPWARTRPDAELVTGTPLYVENCEACHVVPARNYQESLHAAKGIRCGQCHVPGGHPDYSQPVSDGKCGGCHQDAYQQTLASVHYAKRALRPLDADREARKELRVHAFLDGEGGAARFVGDDSSGELGGRLCSACHYDEHRLGLGGVDSADACLGCHVKQVDHYPIAIPGLENRCIQCHVRVGTTVQGQTVNTHVFRSPVRQGSQP